MLEGLQKSVTKNEEGFYEKGNINQEDFNNLKVECENFFKEHILHDSFVFVNDGIYNIKYKDEKGNEYDGKIIAGYDKKDFLAYRKYLISDIKEKLNDFSVFELFYRFTNDGQKMEKEEVVKFSKTPEELRRIFEDLKGYFEKKEK